MCKMTILMDYQKNILDVGGADLQQHINGHITYLPTITPRTPMSAVKYFLAMAKRKFTNFVPRPTT